MEPTIPYTRLGASGVRVSALCLGTMTFGEDWGWGADKHASREIFDHFADAGGNFIDTADWYTNGTSETWLGEFIAGRRERFVIGTKYGLSTSPEDPNAGGSHRKNLIQSLETSLRRLQTDYVDVYWLHVWDLLTPIDEVMRALDDLVRAGKVLYVGVSDAPAWIISYANAIAELRGWSPFVGVQAEYSLARRDAERDLLPMARALGLSLLAWSPLSNGLLTGKYNDSPPDAVRMASDSSSRNRPTERGLAIARAVEREAQQVGCTSAQLALAWLCRDSSVIPMIGSRSAQQLEENLRCLEIEIPDDLLNRLDEAASIELGFPHDFLAAEFTSKMIHGNVGDRITTTDANAGRVEGPMARPTARSVVSSMTRGRNDHVAN